jgi:hypothetical protein
MAVFQSRTDCTTRIRRRITVTKTDIKSATQSNQINVLPAFSGVPNQSRIFSIWPVWDTKPKGHRRLSERPDLPLIVRCGASGHAGLWAATIARSAATLGHAEFRTGEASAEDLFTPGLLF